MQLLINIQMLKMRYLIRVVKKSYYKKKNILTIISNIIIYIYDNFFNLVNYNN